MISRPVFLPMYGVIALLSLSVSGLAATGRAMSLNAAMAAARSGGSSAAASLCGITRVTGFVRDSRSSDIILIGEVRPELPALRLDDLVVAIRSAWMVYARKEGRVRYYSPPGCSIDPDPAVLRELQQIHGRDISDPEAKAAYLEQWKQVGTRPQTVRVLGVPFDTRFAKVMVDADYYMKRLANGSVSLDLPGFESLSDITVRQAKEALAAGREDTIPSQSMSRFWFSPAGATYCEQDGACVLETCGVSLLTEEEFLTESGIAGMRRPNELAKQFAAGFTHKYQEIAKARPVYRELEGLFRFVGLSKIMRENGASASGLGYLLNGYRVGVVPVSRKVLGLTSVRELSGEHDTPQGHAAYTMIIPTCGGVSIDVRPKRVKAARVTSSVNHRSTKASPAVNKNAKPKASLKTTVLAARKSPQSLSWDFPVKENR